MLAMADNKDRRKQGKVKVSLSNKMKTTLSKKLDKMKVATMTSSSSSSSELDKSKVISSNRMKAIFSKKIKALPAKKLDYTNLVILSDKMKSVSLNKLDGTKVIPSNKMEAMSSENFDKAKVVLSRKMKAIKSKKFDRTKVVSLKKMKAMPAKNDDTEVILLKKMKVITSKKLVTGKAISSNNKKKTLLSLPAFHMGTLMTVAMFLLMFLMGGVCGQSAWPPQLNSSAGRGGAVADYPKECDSMFSLDGLLELQSGGPTPILNNCSAAIYANVSSNLDFYTLQLGEKYSFCSEDPIADRDSAFDFSQNLTFMGRCFVAMKGGLLDRTCSAGEIEVYFQALLNMATSGSGSPSIVSDNCNDTMWSQGCESGWCSSLNGSAPSPDSEQYKEKGYIPPRSSDPQPCCDGFFCPMGLTCMIPCPLGAYCPRATLNHTTGLCEPYNYRVAFGRNNTCGGANFWADFSTSSNVFCPAGNYCPTTTFNITCDEGHYCSKGSIAQSRCFQLVSCDARATTQNIKRYGVMIIVALALILLIFYNCSDQVMHVQDRRKAKARERALRQVRGSLNAAERWKKAAVAVRRMQRSSHSGMGTEETQTLAPSGTIRSDMSTSISFEGIGEDSSYRSRGGPVAEKRISPLNINCPPKEELRRPPIIAPLPRMPMPADNRSGGGGGGFKQRLPSTRSQIMRYAYNQIEKEKALQSKPLSWNDVIVHAGQPSGRDRLKVEIEFHDLCLILKGSGKKILCDVTGKLSPCRVTAVMGPSGAGKTTFLNALAGKACNSRITGQILINGVENPIHSYKKIIGFVPQDDIVHGNLTVEENLWFSANYRLPFDMPKADKVLVVERIIESLGLQHIRASKVGTVEKRGISGGQRKRVNVGLEMVMEPSLLILDEPTSGLDSTSSQLVLKALRREAVVGVNVGVVLHQPSYGLFRMFDDVMFLAKGGRTVYLGPVDEVEDYFRSLNILVPERINPPDHFMDVLEGIAKPIGEPNFDPKVLPIEWINHKGYMIPADLQRLVTQTDGAKKIKLNKDVGSESVKSESLMLDLCREFLFYLGYRWDEFKSTFNMAEDNSRRITPGFFTQFKLIIRRVAKQRFREANLQVQDYIILLLAGACLGALSPVSESNLGAGSYAFTIIALSLLCMIASLRTFSNEKLQYWRESASGINRIAYFLAKDTVDHFNTILKPVVYLSMFYFFNNPRSTFAENYVVTLALVYAVVGIAYIFAITMDSGPAQLWSVFFPVISTLIVTRPRPDGILKLISNLTYASWAQQAYVIANARRYSGVWLVTRCLVLGGRGYRVDNWLLCVGILLGYGFVARVVAMLCLIFCNRNKQK